VIVAAVLITAPAPTKVMLRNVVYSDVQQASSALKQLVLGKHQVGSSGCHAPRGAQMLAAIVDVSHIGYPLLFLLVMSESGGVPVPARPRSSPVRCSRARVS